MATVHSSRLKKYELLTSNSEQPTCHIESEGDRLIKRLCTKQLDKDFTLEKQKRSEKQFTRGSGFVPLSVYNPGTSTVQELKELTDKAERLEELQLRGLTTKEANAIINGEDVTFPDSKIEESIRISRAEQIKKLIKNSSNNEQQKLDNFSRHEKELALAVKPHSIETKLLQFAMSCQSSTKRDVTPVDHPINHLSELERALFTDHKPNQLVNTIRRKRRQYLESSLPPQGATNKTTENKSLWDVDILPHDEQKNNNSSKRSTHYTCRKKILYTINDGNIVEINEKTIKTPKPSENRNDDFSGDYFVAPSCSNGRSEQSYERLSDDQIRSLERFKNYDPGSSSEVLYIKNLGNGVNENDLVQLFCRFEKPDAPCITYRLMTGKMKGQAFITFPNKNTAVEALNSINGTIIKGKPVIIQFGKSSRTELTGRK